MTEKRFYYAHGIIFDTHKPNHINKIGVIKDLDIGLRIVDWLNGLYEENQALQGEVVHYKLILMSLEEKAKRICQIHKGGLND